MIDSVSDFLARVRNASSAGHEAVVMPVSKHRVELARVLVEQGYVRNVTVDKEKKSLTLGLKYLENREPVLKGGRRVSRPGRRVYVEARKIPLVRDGIGEAVLSTSQGVMSGRQAFKRGIGGEFLFEVW